MSSNNLNFVSDGQKKSATELRAMVLEKMCSLLILIGTYKSDYCCRLYSNLIIIFEDFNIDFISARECMIFIDKKFRKTICNKYKKILYEFLDLWFTLEEYSKVEVLRLQILTRTKISFEEWQAVRGLNMLVPLPSIFTA